MSKKVRMSELSNEAVYGLNYALAVVEPTKYAKRFAVMDKRADQLAAQRKMYVMSKADKMTAIRKGLNELWERGLIDLARTAEGSHEPACVHLDKIENDGGLLILSEGN